MCLEKIKSQRGKDLLVVDGYLHNFHQIKSQIEIWRCQERICKGRIYVKDDEIVDFIPHDHLADIKKITRISFNNKIKAKALDSNENSSQIVAEVAKTFTSEQILDLAKKDSIRKIISRVHEKKLEIRINPFNDIPEILRRDVRGDIFLRYDSGQSDINRFVIFGSKHKIDILEKCQNFIIDGTFYSTPGNFYQLLTIHSTFLGGSFPIFYILLKNKQESTYVLVLNHIKNMYKTFQPVSFVTDFEKALSNAIAHVFPQSFFLFCYFYFPQSLWRRIQENLVKRYFSDIE